MKENGAALGFFFIGIIPLILACFSQSFAASSSNVKRVMQAGSLYVTGFQWPHDGRPFESDHFIIFSDWASDEARQQVARFAEDALNRIKQLFQIENEEIFLYPPGQDKIHIYAYKNYFPKNWGGGIMAVC